MLATVSCSNCSFPGLGKWKQFDGKKKFSKYKKFPIALLLYSSSDSNIKKIIHNKNISSLLSAFTLLYIDTDNHPYILRRFGEETPSLSFINRDGVSIYSMYPIDVEKLKILVPQLVQLQGSLSIDHNSLKEDLSPYNMYPGEEREISEFVMKKLQSDSSGDSSENNREIPLDLLSYTYRDTGDEKVRQLITNAIKDKLTSKSVDPVQGGIWSENGYAKMLEDFASYYIDMDKALPYCKECSFNLDYSVNTSLAFIEQELKNNTPLFYAGLKYEAPYNLFVTEKDLTNMFGNDGFKRLEKALSLSYKNLDNHLRYILFSPKIVSAMPSQDIENLKKSIATQSRTSKIKEYRAYGNILLARLYVRFGNYQKSVELKNNIDRHFLDKNGMIKIKKDGYTYFRDNVEYMDLLIDLYKANLEPKYLAEAIALSKLMLKFFCEEWDKTVICSDLPYEVLKTHTGFLSFPDYSITFNSKFALCLLRLYAITNEESIFKLSYNILGAFKHKAKKMMRARMSDPLLIYTKALIVLHSNPLKLYLIYIKPTGKQNLEKDVMQKISSIGYPSVILNVIKNTDELSALYTKEKNMPSDIKANMLVVCLGEECSSISKIHSPDLPLEIEKFIINNKDRVLRVIPFWQ